MMAAAMAEGLTIMENVAKEPHVVDVANFLNSMGANIRGAGTDVIKIRGVQRLHSTEYSVIPDQIEAGTFMFAAAATKGDVTVMNVIPKHLEATIAKLIEIGCEVEEFDDAVRVVSKGDLRQHTCEDAAIPGIPDRHAASDWRDTCIVQGDKYRLQRVFLRIVLNIWTSLQEWGPI